MPIIVPLSLDEHGFAINLEIISDWLHLRVYTLNWQYHKIISASGIKIVGIEFDHSEDAVQFKLCWPNA
jgi:hypothetical protein